MLDNSLIAQFCAILGLIFMALCLLTTFIKIPTVNIQTEYGNTNAVRAVLIIVLIGLLRGAS